MRPDNDANEALYGQRVSAHDIVLGLGPQIPEAARQLDALLEKVTPRPANG